jgi:hypothetical protein
MTYGRVRCPPHGLNLTDAAVSHLAELVRGESRSSQGPLIRPFGPPSPQGEKVRQGRTSEPPATFPSPGGSIHPK